MKNDINISAATKDRAEAAKAYIESKHTNTDNHFINAFYIK